MPGLSPTNKMVASISLKIKRHKATNTVKAFCYNKKICIGKTFVLFFRCKVTEFITGLSCLFDPEVSPEQIFVSMLPPEKFGNSGAVAFFLIQFLQDLWFVRVSTKAAQRLKAA